MNEIITTTGVTITLDESAGLQNLTATPAPGGDANDNDIANSALPSVFSARLTALGLGSPTIGTALSGYTGAAGNTGSNIISVTPEPGGTITDLGFVGPGGAPLNGLDSDLNTLTGTNILLYTDTNNNIVLGRAGAADGPIVFALYLEETGTPVSGAKIWSVQYAPLENIDPTNPDDSLNLLDKVFVAASQDLEFSLANAPSGQNLFLMFTTANPTTVDDNGVTRITDPAIIATGKDPANQSTGANITTGDTVNSSQGGGTTTFGTNSQMIVEGDGIHFSFVTGARQNVTIPNLDQNEADVEANIDFTDVFDARAATFDVVQLQSGKSAVVKVSALSTDSEPGVDFIDGYGDDNSVPITHVKVALQNGTVLIDTSTGGTANGVTVAFNTGVATISGIKAGYNIEYTTTADHNRVLVENAGSGRGNASADFDIGGFQLLQVSATTVEVGSKVNFEDDGPSINTTGTEPTLTVDETVLATNDTKNFAANFTSAFGTDGAGTLTFALGISASGVDSELVDTATNNPVFLFLESGVVVGREGTDAANAVGGDVVFTVGVVPSGVDAGDVTLDQQRAVVHPDATNPDDAKSLLVDTLVTLTGTIIDEDGDSQSATLNIGQNLVFEDDGPTVTANSLVKLDDDALAGNPGGTGDDIDAENVSGTLAHSFGADGAGSIAYLTTGAPAGFSYVADGDNLLVQQGGVTVLTLTLNTATGAYLVTQNAPIVHAAGLDENNQAFTINYRVTDGDGDTADGTLALDVDDDTPTVAANSLVKLDDDALAGNPGGTGDDIDAENVSGTLAHSFGADGAGSIAYLTTGAPAGFSYVADGDNLLVKQGTTTVLTMTLNTATGAYLVTQNAPIAHAAGLDENNQAFTINYRVADGDGDTADGTLAIDVDDDTPTLDFGNLVGTGTIAPQYGEWNGSVGADQPGNLDISLSQFQLVRPDGSTIAGSSFTFNELAGSPNPAGDFLFAGSLTADFDNNAGTADTTVDFTLTALQNGRYVFDLIQGFGSTITFSSANGSLDAGGPDAVRTLTIPPDEQVVFFGLQATTSDSDIVSAIGLGEPDLTEAQIEAGGFSFLGSANMNVSTSGIGIGNNNLDGNGTAGINAGDESFVINPETLLTGVKVFIDNSVGGYDPATEELYYKIFFDDGTNSGSIKVLSGDLTSEAGGQKSFAIDTQGAKLIDSVQLTMGKGVIKVPVIEFIKSTENLASDVKLDFSASLTDADSDTATSNFSVDLFANDLGQTFDFTLVGASSDLDGFDVDLSASQVSYKIEGFDKPADKLFLLGDSGAGVSIDNSGANSIVSVTETTGGQTTVITVVGVDLASSDIVLI
ncbi:DUF5801 repeats-in-toxin domain-containing protein [Nitrosomonas ureae]|uniref:DUF5801 domain-containing protein n=1 Tax=Nitrosomonas ureae TaxID=44577 RepID=A0A1H5SWL0_9PROT|nr:DUF5801 repeats-in-toxin domain-containing protein [Nitrosomonas ureae]SEF55012.1 hypothetical protein SAMN05216334_103130 [Nitrosomonas ureae]